MPHEAQSGDELRVLQIVASLLDAAGIPYMLTGSLALTAYAPPRMTRDVDFVVDVAAGDSARIAAAFSDDFYCEREAVDRAVRTRRSFNVIHQDLIVKVDLFVRKDSEYRREEFRRRRLLTIAGRELWVVAPEDLILSKLLWIAEGGSQTQLEDVRSILASTAVDRPYLERWARELGVHEMLVRAGE